MHTLKLLIWVALIAYASAAAGGLIGRQQSAGAKGRLTCNGKPLGKVLIKLYDDDRGLDMDDLMASGKSNSDGTFQIMGSNKEFTKIDPKINIYHDCNDGWKPCQRKVSIMIPDSYITNGPIPNRIYDIGTLELAGKFKGETRDCLH